MANVNWRTIPVDVYDPESTLNFPLPTLLPPDLPPPATTATMTQISTQVRQLLRSGDTSSALATVLDTAPLGGDAAAQTIHAQTVIEVLQGIRQSDVSHVLGEVLQGPRGRERGDTLMKYLYRGMAGGPATGTKGDGGGGGASISPQATGFSQIQARNLTDGGSGQTMSVLLSWHEKLVDVVGVGGIVRVMCDRRTV